jgi:hypothetical protein
MDEVSKSVEDEVNDALKYPFRFHKVNKIVLCLGPGEPNARDYIEQLGVGLKQWPDFDLGAYVKMNRQEKIEVLRSVVLDTFDWLEQTFDDAQFVAVGRKNLPWAGAT